MVAKRNGAVGAVIDGATRDTAELEQLRFPTWAAGVTPIPGGYGGYSVAEVDTPVNCRGVEVCPGDVVVADGDGVIVVPADDVAALIDVCEAMNADERASHEALAAGKSMDESYPSRSYYTRKA